MRTSVALALLAVLGAQGCDTRACTEIGGFDGVGVEIPRSLFVRTGHAAFEVCDERGCASATHQLARVPEGPVGRGAAVTFGDLGREFEPGPVTVTVDLFGPGAKLVAVTRQEVDLDRWYPNGKACDGEGWVRGTLRMQPGDRV